ncbi:MAG: hypothetical protein HN742_05440 [Lentisphaerae bacterium]|nr:hypothetical protein [Lentisphaerota bacterium]MBT7841292.1 hypothetical protein [Lentisphaerota bacterium]
MLAPESRGSDGQPRLRFVLKSHTSLAFASCSIAQIRGCNLAVKVKTGRGMAAPPTFGERLLPNVVAAW